METIRKYTLDDPRVLWLILIVILAFPMFFPLSLPLKTTEMTESFFREVEKLQPGDTVLISHYYALAKIPEMSPVSQALIAHYVKLGVKVVAIEWGATGPIIADKDFMAIYGATEDHPQYGIDFVNLGFVPGGSTGMASFAADIWATSPVDWYGNPIETLPLMQELRTITDFTIVTPVCGTGQEELIGQFQAAYDVKMAFGCSGVVVPKLMPYLNSGQIFGIINGIKGGAEYEILLGTPGAATAAQSSMTLAHGLGVLLIIIGNVMFFTERKSENSGG